LSDRFDHCPAVLACQSVQKQRGHLRIVGPVDFKLRAASHDQEDAHLRKPRDRATEELEGGWVGPVHVFENDENGSLLS
jgi:hypothetical protein